MVRRMILFAIAVALAGCSPQNYEDCVLDAMKTAGSYQAALIARAACREKFPLPTTQTVNTRTTESLWDGNLDAMNNVQILSIESDNTVVITNKSNYNIHHITLGATHSQACSNDKSEYSQFTKCGRPSTTMGQYADIPPNSTHKLTCEYQLPQDYLCLVRLTHSGNMFDGSME